MESSEWRWLSSASREKLAHTLTPTCVRRNVCLYIIYIHTNACADKMY